ncbi:MAG: S8 family serine peptidase [bacterium]
MGYTQSADVVNNAINSATSNGRNNKGCVVIKSAGNNGEGSGGITFPGQHPKVIAVGATKQNDTRRDYSSYGSALDVMAPSHVYATDLTGSKGNSSGDYMSSFTGTSAAAPHVAGLAGLVLSLDNSLTEQEIREIICYTADDKGDTGWDQYYGWGRINAYDAVLAASGQVTISGTLQSDEVWWQDDITLNGNVNVPNGIVLRIINGASVDLNNYYIKCTGNGKIIKQGSVSGMKHYAKSGSYYKGLFPSSNTIQQIIDLSTSGWDIYVGTGTYTENINMKAGVDVIGSGMTLTTINGTINFNNDYNASLTDVTVNNKITVNNSDGVSISSFKAGHSNCYIDVASTSWLDVLDMTSLVSQTRGIYAHSSSDFSVITGLIKNKMDGVHLQENSYGEMWWINFCNNSYYDIIAFSSSADAYGCTFSSSEEGGSVSGDVDWDIWNWCGEGGFGKKTADQTSAVVNDINTTAVSTSEPALNDFKEIMHSYSTMKKTIREDRQSEKGFTLHNYKPELESVIEKFKQFVVTYPKSPYTPSVLGRLAAVWRILGNFETLSMYMKGIANNPALQHLRPFALNALMSMHIKQEEYVKAIELSDQLMEEYTDHPLIVEWLYGKGILYKYHLDKPTLAQEMFKMILTEFPHHPTAQSARDELKDSEHKVIGKEITEKDITESNHALKLTVQSMPNPFNPQTAIHFTLPEPGKVILTIYDILGRKVKTLVEGHRTAGTHLARWDGCDATGRAVASGTYIYRLQFKEKVLSRKLVLIW